MIKIEALGCVTVMISVIKAASLSAVMTKMKPGLSQIKLSPDIQTENNFAIKLNTNRLS